MKPRSGPLSSLKEEHRELSKESTDNTRTEGTAGGGPEAAAGISHSHSVKERESAVPLHESLWVRGKERATTEMQKALALTDRLKGELEQMVEDHEAAIGKLRKLSERYARLARKFR